MQSRSDDSNRDTKIGLQLADILGTFFIICSLVMRDTALMWCSDGRVYPELQAVRLCWWNHSRRYVGARARPRGQTPEQPVGTWWS